MFLQEFPETVHLSVWHTVDFKNHSFAQPHATEADQKVTRPMLTEWQKKCTSIRTVILSSSTTEPQTSTFGELVWNIELEKVEGEKIQLESL